jgi:hypothetical protein
MIRFAIAIALVLAAGIHLGNVIAEEDTQQELKAWISWASRKP